MVPRLSPVTDISVCSDEQRALTMAAKDHELRNPDLVALLMPFMRTLVKVWFRSEVRGLEHVPDGGALMVSNHSGGLLTMDVPVMATAFFDRFGVDRPFYALAHDILFVGPWAGLLHRAGIVHAAPDVAHRVLRGGGVVMVFPGGDYDVYRPTTRANTIDFQGRTGYVETAFGADVPIVPVVSIGGQENQIYLSRGQWLAQTLRLPKLVRSEILPITVGFPFGLSLVLPINIPLPTKIVTRILEPIDVRAQFGNQPDSRTVDIYVRQSMQSGLDDLARRRRFPVLG